MSKIEKLIKELCPNGVEYKKIKEICISNFWIMPSTPKYQTTGIPYITSKNIRNGIVQFEDTKFITEQDYKLISNNRPIKVNDFLISMIGTIGEVGIVKESDLPFYGQNMYLLRLDFKKINLRFFYHYFISSKVRKVLIGEKNNGNQGYLKTKNIELLKIPVPALEVQEEIVRILDKFGELEAELETELEARKSQYEFWRDKLFEQNVKEKCMLEDILKSLKTGLNPRKFFKVNTVDAKNYYVTIKELGERNARYWESKDRVNSEGLQRINERSNLEVDDVLFSGTGTIGKVSLIEEEPKNWNVKEGVYILKPKKEKVIPTYLMYLMKSNYMKKLYSDYIVGSPVSSIPMKELKKIKISLPSLQEQERIVDILDKFDKLVNDISEGLPAEMEARRKQYEYYRNKLLSFEEMNINE